ncbi:MAG: PKD domain-containing protein, partial [Saprospiraceae bacterium]|nr:PKD domain-containing protein [Saprospiraceae bacterium]
MLRFLVFLLLPLGASAQIKRAELPAAPPKNNLFSCGSAAAQEALFSANPALARQLADLEDLFYRPKTDPEKTAAGGKYPSITLPVVFHVVHNNGAENISDAQILAALGHLNDAFAHTGYFNQEGEDTGIQFCLAKRTPEGLATSGITRTESPLTNIVMEYQDLDLKDLIRWDPTRYINIWVVASITSASQGPGVAGYAYLPFSHGSPFDGMVCEAEFLGFEPAANAVLIHEMGHYLGLYHTFEGGCPNGDCLLDGDRVCDTPPDQAQHSVCPFNSCNTDADAPAPNPFSGDVDDLSWNFMDYSNLLCYKGFTAGQRDRMQDVLAFARKSLLESDGCQDPCTQLISAAFAIDPPSGLSGELVQLVNTTTGATQYEWYVNGVLISNAPAPAYTFGAPGVYNVALIASNADANCTEELDAAYVVTCPVEAALSASQTQILPGETVSFSDNSVNALSWQWMVDGVPAGNTQSLVYQFNTPGVYTVALTAGNGFCSDQAAVAVQVEGPCGGLVKLGHYRSGEFGYPKAAINSTLFHTTGDIFGAGSFKNTTVNVGLLAKWNSAAQLQWAKKADNRYFHKILETPDGNWVAYSSADLCVTAKFTPDGDVLWARSFDVPGSDHPAYIGLDHLAVLPNGDIAVLIHGLNYTAYIFRLDSDGNLLWQKSFTTITASHISPASDGSNNLIVIVLGSHYFILSADGQQIVEMKEMVFVGDPALNGLGLTRCNQHPDGSFTLWATHQFIGPPEENALVMLHFSASGALLWTKSFETPQFVQYYVRYYPGDGWLFNMNLNLEHILMRINDDGSTRWTRRFTGGGPAYLFHGITGLAEAADGRVAGVSNFVYDTAFYLLLFDPRQPDNCDLT